MVYSSSAELVKDRYAVQAIPTVDTNGWSDSQLAIRAFILHETITYNLELDGNDAEIQDLHRRPQNEIGFEGRQVDILKLASQGPPPTALGHRHESEEAPQTWKAR